MRVSVATVAEFVERVGPAYLDIVQGPPDEPASLEIDLAPGDYRAANFSVGDPLDRRTIDIVIRGADAARPPVLTDMSLRLTGDRVRLEQLIFAGRVDHLPVVSVTAGQSLTIDGCAWLGNQVRMPPDGRLLEVIAKNPQGATAVAIRHTWFVRNWAPDGQAVLVGVTNPPYYFQRIGFERVAFLDNHGAVGIVPHATAALDFADCIVVQAGAGADPPAALAAVTSPGTQLTIERSLLVAEGLAGLVTRWSPRQPSASAFQAVTISHSEVVLCDPAARRDGDEGMRLHDTEVRLASAAGDAALVAAIDACAAEVERGSIPDLVTLRAAIAAAI